jgi:integrase
MDKRRAIAEMFRHLRKDTDATKLKPDDFEAFRRHLGQGVGPSSLSQRVIHIRAMFRWAGPENQRLLPSLPHWADKFPNVTEAERLDARDDNEKINGERKFSVETAHAILREIRRRADAAWADYGERGVGRVHVVAQRWLLAVNLIAANTGAYASDIAALAPEDVDLDGQRWVDKKRVKTRRHRIKWQAPLWPETVAAIRSYREVRPAPDADALEVWRQRRASESDAPAFKRAALATEPVFLTADGCPLVRDLTHYRWDGVVRHNTPIDSVGQAMGKLLGEGGMGIKYVGLNFGAWRHTFKSLAEETGREKFVKRIMGHTVGKIDERYFKPTADQLRLVTDLVRERLLPPEMRIESEGDGSGR